MQGSDLELHIVGDVKDFCKNWIAAATSAAGVSTTLCAQHF